MSRDRSGDDVALEERRLAEAAAREASAVDAMAAEAAAAEVEKQAAQDAALEAEKSAALAEYRAYADLLDFSARLTADGCGAMIDEAGQLSARETWMSLAEYQSARERTTAIKALEGCRNMITTTERKLAKIDIRNARADFGIAIEDAYDEANPYNKGELVAEVKGTQLQISMPGGFEGRARHTESQVLSWCETDSAVFFSKITLKSKVHGTFSCVPYLWPGSEAKLIELLVSEYLSGGPWSTKAGEKPVPTAPEMPEEPTSAEPMSADSAS